MTIGSAAPVRRFRVRDVVLHGAEPPPLRIIARQPWFPWLIVGITCIGASIGQLDASIVQLTLPTLKTTFNVSLETVSWVSLGYLLAFAASLPIFGRLCEIFGRKLLYLCGYALFTTATLLCGFAPNLAWLIFFRIVQGIGGALLGANSISILVKAVGPDRRSRALGIFAAAQAVGISAGPAIGGVLIGAYGWRWVFWATVPFGAAATILGWLALPQSSGLAQDKTFDWRGALLLAPALIALVLALNQASALGLLSPALLGCLAVFAVLTTLLVRHERACAFPLVDLRLFSAPAFSCGIVGVVLAYALLYAMFFLMSFALIHGYDEPPALAGLRLAIIPVALGVVAPFSGALTDRFGPRAVSVSGMALCIASLVVLTLIAAELRPSHPAFMIMLALYGAGLGLFIAPNNSATISAAPASLSGEAGAMLNLMRVLGTSLGIVTASEMLSWRMQVRMGVHSSALSFAPDQLVAALEGNFMMLATFALVAAAASLVRSRRPI